MSAVCPKGMVAQRANLRDGGLSYVEGSEERDEAAERADGLTGRNGREYTRKEERENQAVSSCFLARSRPSYSLLYTYKLLP